MSTEAPHPIHPSQPELDFAAPETAPEPATEQPPADYDETPPPEAIEPPPPPETIEISDEELEALDEMNADAAATVCAVPASAQPPHVSTIVVNAPGFGEQLQSLRVQHKLTIGELAAKTHMTASAIQDLESGDVTRLNSNANYHYCRSQIERICQAYGEGISPWDAQATDFLKKRKSSSNQGSGGTNFKMCGQRRNISIGLKRIIIDCARK